MASEMARLVLEVSLQSLPGLVQRQLTKAALGTDTGHLRRELGALKDVLQADADFVRVLPSLSLAGTPTLRGGAPA